MFNYPVTEIYKADGERACVFSAEQYEAKLAEGWSDTQPVLEQCGMCATFGIPCPQEFNTDAPLAVTAPEFELMIAEAGPEVIVVPPAPHKRRKK